MDGYMDGADCLGSDMDAGVLHFNWSGFEPIQGILGTDHGLDWAHMQLFWFFETSFWAWYSLQIKKTIEDGGNTLDYWIIKVHAFNWTSIWIIEDLRIIEFLLNHLSPCFHCVTRAPLLYFIRSWVALSFKACQWVSKGSVTPIQTSTLFNI